MSIRLSAAPLTREVLGVPVVEGPVPEPWDAAVVEDPVLWADADRLLFRAEAAAVHVTADSVVLDVAPHARAEMDWLLYATAARAVLTFRRRFNLHATLVVAPDGSAVGVLGDSGAGKSTTTVELVRRGWRLASDDIVEVVVGADGVVAHPVDRPIHLSDEAALLLGADLAQGRYLPGRDKRVYRVADAELAPHELAALVVLTQHDGAGVHVEQVDPLAAVPTIATAGDRYRVCRLSQHREAFLGWTTEICRRVPIAHVARPDAGDTVTSVADAVERIASA